jgi:hypothetical protein
MEGLGAVLGAAALVLTAELNVAGRRGETFGFDCFTALPLPRVTKDTKLILAFWLRDRVAVHFTSGSVPEQNPIRHRLSERRMAPPCALACKRPAAGPTATTALTPWRITVPTVEQPAAVVVPWSAGSPERDSEVAGDALA